MMRDRGVRRLLVKFLSPNDNSKNQVYLGGDLGVMNIIPAGDPVAGTSGTHKEPIFKASVKLSWLDAEGRVFPASNSQLILYPQYPEVRLSGFLRGAKWAPSDVMTVRDEGRVLLLGLGLDGAVLAFAADGVSALASELRADPRREELGVFYEYPLVEQTEAGDSRARLLAALCRIHRAGWIAPWMLGADGSRRDCKGTNCVGVTLESELGVLANGRPEPDFEGWEVKAHTVASLDRSTAGAITLMTPEPTGGYYKSHGVIEFVKKFGYADKLGRPDRMNFGGMHRAGEQSASTGLTLRLDGYDAATRTLLKADGALVLVSGKGVVAASWPFASLLAHWQKKHARAAFVPALRRAVPTQGFRYGNRVLLAVGTDYLRLLDALAAGSVYYDPGIKVEHLSARPRTKRRSQFRVASRDLALLYADSKHEVSCVP